MQQKKKYRLPFTKSRANGNSATHSSPTPKDTQSHKWYQSIVDLPLNRFIDCACNNNLSALIISGFPDPEQLTIAWAEINEQYSEAMGDSTHKLYVTLFKEVTALTIDLRQIAALIELLYQVKYKPFEDRLNSLLFTNFRFEDNRTKELETCTRLSKSIAVKIDLKTARLVAMQSGNVDKKKPTPEYFYSVLITLSDHAQYQITDSVTVFEYCERVKRLGQYVDKQKQKQKSNGRGSHR